MSALNRYIFTLFAVCCCSFMATNANATVCFAADGGSCGGTSSFSDYTDPNEETTDQCTQIGYDTSATECISKPGMQIGGYCPYNNTQVKCCTLDYVYNSCVYPFVLGDAPAKCGSKLRCKCDPDTYKFSTVASCTAKNFANSMPGGASCTYVKSVQAATGNVENELVFKDCVCDRGIYPYTEADCNNGGNNAEATGATCRSSIKDADGYDTYYAACKCDTDKFPYTNDSCEFGGDTTGDHAHCVQAGIWFFRNCCSCSAYPALGEPEKGPNDPNVDRTRGIVDGKERPLYYDQCPCVKGYKNFKIKRCKIGYRPSTRSDDYKEKNRKYFDGEACVPVSCEDATKIFLAQNPSSIYGLWKGTNQIYTYRFKTNPDGSYVYNAQGVPEFTEMAKTSGTPLLAGQVTVNTSSCASNQHGIGCLPLATSYYSAHYVGNYYSSTSSYKILREACTAPAKINFNDTSFPSSNNSSYSISLYNVDLNFNKTTTVYRNLYVYNSKLSSSSTSVTYNKSIGLYNYSYYPNRDGSAYEVHNSTFKNGLYSSGYGFNVNDLYFEIPTSKPSVSITLNSGQDLTGNNLYLYPTYDTYVYRDRNNGNTFPYATDYNYSMSITGPSSSIGSNVYINAYIGYNGSKRARKMYIKLSSNVTWNMYGNSKNYELGLSSGSNLSSTDYNSGNYARIAFGTDNHRRYCQMSDYIEYVINRHKFLSCACKRYAGDSKFYAACKISGSTGSISTSAPSTGVTYSCRSAGDCGCRDTKMGSGCKLNYQCGDGGTRDVLLTCGK